MCVCVCVMYLDFSMSVFYYLTLYHFSPSLCLFLSLSVCGLYKFGFFIERHINLRSLFNMEAILGKGMNPLIFSNVLNSNSTVFLNEWVLLGITHLFPHNELVHLPFIAVAIKTRAD